MVQLNRIFCLIVLAAIIVIRFLEFRPVSAFWGTLLLPVIPIGLAALCIWYGDEGEDWFGIETAFPRWAYRAVGWFVLLLYLAIDFVRWRMIAPYRR